MAERLAARALDGHAIGHRIGKRHADLDHVRGLGNGRELLAKLRAFRIACGEERHQRRLAAARALPERRRNPLTGLPSTGPRKQFAREGKHVLVAASGEPDQDALARMGLRPAARAGQRVRALDRRQYALALAALAHGRE